jgi:hypothetical protein
MSLDFKFYKLLIRKMSGTCKTWCLQTNTDIRLFPWSSTSFPVQTEPVSSLQIRRTCFIKTQEKLRSHFDTSLPDSSFLVNIHATETLVVG